MKRFLFSWLYCSFFFTSLFAQQYSELWGKNGEKWNPVSRLPDFSYAGYHSGEEEIPELPVKANVKDFGSVGDGLSNDTEAFQKALQSVSNGAILVPEGTYKITDRLLIDKSNVVLRGENRDKTILYFPWYLNDIDPNWGATTSGRPTSNYSWAGGYIHLAGDFGQETLTQIAEVAQRGDTEIEVKDASGLTEGQFIEVYLTDTEEHTLLNFLYAGDPSETDRYNRIATTSQVVRIVEIKNNTITIDRPLRFQTDQQWQPEVRTFAPTVQESGVENLTFLFPAPPYEGHFTELGHNAIAMSKVAHCWVRNIRIKNSDSGIFLSGRFCTVDGVIFESERAKEPQRQSTGHHAIYIGDDDNLFTNFLFRTKFIHDISVSHCAGNVISEGAGVDLCFDHHKRNPYANLFTNIHLGEGQRMWQSGGGRNLGRHSAAWETFWNIRALSPQSWNEGYGPAMMNLVGVEGTPTSETSEKGKWIESIPPAHLYPENLHQAQLEYRLGKNEP